LWQLDPLEQRISVNAQYGFSICSLVQCHRLYQTSPQKRQRLINPRSSNSDNVLLKRTQSTFKIQHLEKKVIMKSGEMPELALAMLQGPKAAAAVSTKRKGLSELSPVSPT
jgi:hypothetical protein